MPAVKHKYLTPTPYVRSPSKALVSPFVVQKPLLTHQGFVPRVETPSPRALSSLADAEQLKQAAAATSATLRASPTPGSSSFTLSQQGLPPQPPPSPTPGQLEGAAAAGGSDDADEEAMLPSIGVGIELEPLEKPVEPDSLPSLALPASPAAADVLSSTSNTGFGPPVLYGELLSAPYTPSGQSPLAPLAGAASSPSRRGWGQSASSQRIGASMGTMMARPTSRGLQGITRGSSISILGQRPVSARMLPPNSPTGQPFYG